MTAYQPVSFAEYLKLLPPDFVLKHFLKNSNGGRRIISSSTIGDIARGFAQAKTIEQRFDSLSPDAKRKCSLACLFSYSGLKADGVKGFDDELLGSFLVHVTHTPGSGLSYRPFPEFEHFLRKKAAKILAQMLKVPAPAVPARHASRIMNDLVIVMVLASQGTVKVTKNGVLAKSSHQALKKLLHAGKLALKSELDASVCELLQYACQQNMLIDTGLGYCSNDQQIMQWLKNDRSVAEQETGDFLLAEFPGWNWDVVRAMLDIKEKTWLSVRAFPDSCAPAVVSALRVGELTGKVEVVRHGEQIYFGRPAEPAQSNAAAPGNHLTIMPDFNVIIPQEADPSALYWFLRMGTCSSLDHVYKGTIDKETVCNSLAAGINGTEMLDRLKEWHAPHNVQATVKEWVREFGRVAQTDGPAILSTDPQVTLQISSYEPLKQILAPIPVHTAFRIRPGRERDAAEILRSVGFDIRMPAYPGVFPAHKHEDITEARRDDVPETVVDFGNGAVTADREVRSSKYSSELKILDTTDLLQVIDYAILMGQKLRFDYTGSMAIRNGQYVVLPFSYTRGSDGVLEAQDARTTTKKKFVLDKIKSIGVVPE